MAEMASRLRALPFATWPRAAAFAVIAAAVIGVPSALIDSPFFGRPVPVRAIDYIILAVTSTLIGLILAIRAPASAVAEADEQRTLWGGLVSFLAVGCPVCNQAVVALLGTSGALAWWAPVQPVVGAAAVALLAYTLRRRLLTYDLEACPVPAAGGVPGATPS